MNSRRISLIIIDSVMILSICALVSLLCSVFGGNGEGINAAYTFFKMCLLFGLIMVTRGIWGIYSSVWRYANTATYIKLLISDVLSTGMFSLIGLIIPSISVRFLYSALASCLIIIVTLCSRFIYQYSYANLHARENGLAAAFLDLLFLGGRRPNGKENSDRINVAIVGAGNIGVTLADIIMRNPKAHYYPYCFIDNDPSKTGSIINGIHVYPENEAFFKTLKQMPIQEVIITLPDLSPEEKTRLYNLYAGMGYKVKLYEYPLGASQGKMREFEIEDLLFRDSIVLNNDEIQSKYADKTILVTGGGGSIGSELCRQIARCKPKKLIILDIYENNAYDIQQELIRTYGTELDLVVEIASVRDVKRLEEVFRTYRPEIVFHAAAHKHVPLMERSSCEAIKNNVFGTYNTANMAEKYGVKKFILISTDKAVNPTNIMGASKRLCEMIIQSRHDSSTEFAAVRFGNVLGSNGSVIPLFKRQIAKGGPVTITDKRIIRYFMTIPEAVGLIMDAGLFAHNGDLFVLDMGKPVKIIDLAEKMIKLSGRVPYKDIDIVEIGLREGEKLYEELLMRNEELDSTNNGLIFIERDQAYSRDQIEEKLAVLHKAVEDEGSENIKLAIKQTVPTYRDPDEVNNKIQDSLEMQTVG